MGLDTNILMIVGFLMINLAVGLYWGRGVRDIKEYALGGRNFKTATLVATIVATWIAGSDFSMTMTEIYKGGVHYFIAGLGNAINLLIVSLIFAPRIKSFFGNLSVAEVMGQLFGKHVKLITAIASIACGIAVIAMQINVFSIVLNHLLDIDYLQATLFCCTIVIAYSTIGGVKAVTITDIIQFITFGVFIPVFVQFFWQIFGNPDAIQASLHKELFDYKQVFTFENKNLLSMITLFLIFCIPSLNPTIFQRILMAKDARQVKISFMIAAFMALGLYLVLSFITLILYSNNPDLVENNIMMYALDQFSLSGFRVLLVIGIIAMVMSTTDSWLNVGAVIFANDICPYFKQDVENKLIISRIFTVFMGFSSVFLVMYTDSLLELFLLSDNFYMPIVTIPLALAIFGFRADQRTILFGMAAGFITVVLWRSQQLHVLWGIDSIIPACLANLVTTLSVNYFAKTPGTGFTGNAPEAPEASAAVAPASSSTVSSNSNILANLKKFTSLEYYEQYKPEATSFYYYLALAVFSTVIVSFSINQQMYSGYLYLVNIAGALSFAIATLFACHELIPQQFKSKYMGVLWYGSIFTSLSFINSFLVLTSNFSHLSLVVFTIHLIMIPLLLGWRTAMMMMLSGILAALAFYCLVIEQSIVTSQIHDAQLKLAYTLLMVGGLSVTIFKSKELKAVGLQQDLFKAEVKNKALNEEISILDVKIEHYNQCINDQQQEIERLGATAQRILNNVNHELRLPIGSVMNFAEMLKDGLSKFNKEQLKMLSDEVYKNSQRVSTMILNMLDLATLSAKKLELNKQPVDLSQLVKERLERCKLVYLDGKDLSFNVDAGESIIVNCDVNYLRQVVDNLIINAINFSKQGKIDISLKVTRGFVTFKIADEGIGIPAEEIYDIFDPFKMGSNTQSKAEGRGVGLALCKAAIEAHDGVINAASKERGAAFEFRLSL